MGSPGSYVGPAPAGTGDGGGPEGSTGDVPDHGDGDDPGETGSEDDLPTSDDELVRDPLRRLTVSEYLATVRDLTGVDLADLAASFPADAQVEGFTNDAGSQTMSFGHMHGFQVVAETVVQRLRDDPPALGALLGCGAGTPGCSESFAEQWLPRAWRRR